MKLKIKQILTVLATSSLLVACNSGGSNGSGATPSSQSASVTASGILKTNVPTTGAIIGYYTNWSAYNGYKPTNIPSQVNTIVYAFEQVGNCAAPYATDSNPTLCNAGAANSGLTGTQDYLLHSTDPYSDFTHYNPSNGDPSSGATANGMGNIAAAANISGDRMLISIGGWSLSSPIRLAIQPAHEPAFTASILTFLKAAQAQSPGYSTIQGADIDWEPNGNLWTNGGANPLSRADLVNYLTFLTDLKSQLLNWGSGKYLSIAITASPATLANIDSVYGSSYLKALANVVNSIDFMTYDYHGQSFDGAYGYTNFNSPLWADTANEPAGSTPGFDINDAVNYALNDGVPASQIVIGSPAYGRAYSLPSLSSSNQANPYQRFNSGVTIAGPQGDGTYTYREIMTGYSYAGGNQTATNTNFNTYVYQDLSAGQAMSTGYADNYSQPALINFDNCAAAFNKMSYAKSKGLAGVMVWSLDGDIQPSDNGLPSGVNYANSSIISGLAAAQSSTTDTVCKSYPNAQPVVATN